MQRSVDLLVLPVGDDSVASVRYRVLAQIPSLERAGFEPDVRFPEAKGSTAIGRRVSRALDLAADARRAASADCVLVHRKTFPPAFARRLRRTRAPIVFDMDDALDLPPPSARATARDRARYARNFSATVAAADLVIVGNRELSGRLPHGRYEILPTPIDTSRFRPGAVDPPSGATLGWVGHSDNFGYLESIGLALRELARRHPSLRLVVVADRAPDLPGVPVEFRKWSLERELDCFSGVAVGLMPLLDTPWARAKCSFKAIQYMALGIPAVCSPVGMNLDLLRSGENGFLPGSEEEWVRDLDALLTDPSLAARVGAAGRRTVERDYSLDALGSRLAAILRDALKGSSS